MCSTYASGGGGSRKKTDGGETAQSLQSPQIKVRSSLREACLLDHDRVAIETDGLLIVGTPGICHVRGEKEVGGLKKRPKLDSSYKP